MKKMGLKTWENRLKFPHLVILVLLALLIIVVRLTRKSGDNVRLEHDEVMIKQEFQNTFGNDTISGCNLFSGRWVYDNVSYPLYKEKECAFMENRFTCELYGRKDLKYQNWRWQPHQCDLPRFNGTALMEKLRGKKIYFVGDSLNRNQWKSMLCLIDPFLPPGAKKDIHLNGNLFYHHSIEYNTTIGFYWAPFLVESNCDNPISHRVGSRIIRVKSIEKHGKFWSDADILIFDSFAWWLDRTLTLQWGSFNSSDAILKTVQMRERRYEMVLSTWSDWVEMHINRTKTKLFFMSASPFREGSTLWGTDSTCHGKTEPISNGSSWETDTKRIMMSTVQSTIKKLGERGVKVEYLDITRLSSYRVDDARPSTYRTYWNMISKEELKNYHKYADCLHWCLPGVPDVWNEILYAYIMKS